MPFRPNDQDLGYQVQITYKPERSHEVHMALKTADARLAEDGFVSPNQSGYLSPARRRLRADLATDQVGPLMTALVGLGQEVYDWWTVPRRSL